MFERVGEVKKVLYRIEKGNLSIVLLLDVLPQAMIILGRVILNTIFTVLKALYDFAVAALSAIKRGVEVALDAFSRLHPALQLLIGAFSGYLLIKNADKVRGFMEKTVQFTVEAARRIMEFLKSIAGLVKELFFVSVDIARVMLKEIYETIELYEELEDRIETSEAIP